MPRNITEHDLRRGVLFCIAVYENDSPVQHLVGLRPHWWRWRRSRPGSTKVS